MIETDFRSLGSILGNRQGPSHHIVPPMVFVPVFEIA
jgi:hypothetical protein